MNGSSGERRAKGRLVFFAPAPSGGAGAERRVLLIAQALVDRGWEVLIIGRSGGGSRFTVKREGKLRIVEVPGFGRRRLGAACFLICGGLLGLLQARRAHGYLALQLSSPATAAAVCGLATARPFLVLSSTSGMLSETSLMHAGRGARLRRTLLRRARALVAQTDVAARELSKSLPGASVVTLPNPAPPLRAPALTGKPYVAYAGRFSEEKDLFSLLQAWEHLAPRWAEARLTLIGSGGSFRSVENELRAEVERGPLLRSTVVFTGWLAETADAVTQSDVFAFPSLSEGMSNALVEACALGRVVVASDIPPNLAVLGANYPLLYPAGDVSALECALDTALGNEAVRSRSLAQIAERIRLLSPDRIVAQLEAVLLDADRARNQ